jgi:ribosomal protein S18 acetylase RimI-like enzyme
MPIAHLPWDSEFFAVKIARATLGEMSLAEAVKTARQDGVECLYITVPGAALESLGEAMRAGAELVDLRTELSGTVDSSAESRVRAATAADLPLLEPMAERLAESSRFRADVHFEADAVAEMYRIWIRRCLDEGVVVVSEDEASGFVGARRKGEEADIELVYVAPEARGAKLAHRLVAAAVHELGTAAARVATQAGNVAAQRLYQGLGFRTQSVEAVLHLWLREPEARPGAQAPN